MFDAAPQIWFSDFYDKRINSILLLPSSCVSIISVSEHLIKPATTGTLPTSQNHPEPSRTFQNLDMDLLKEPPENKKYSL